LENTPALGTYMSLQWYAKDGWEVEVLRAVNLLRDSSGLDLELIMGTVLRLTLVLCPSLCIVITVLFVESSMIETIDFDNFSTGFRFSQ